MNPKCEVLKIKYLCGIIVILHILPLGLIFYNSETFAGSKSYSYIADNWLNYGIYSVDGINPTFYRPPLYPLLLLCAKMISESDWEIFARLLQCLLSIGCSLLVFNIALKVSSRFWAACLGLSLYLLHFLLQSEHFVQRETVLFEFLVLSFCYVFINEWPFLWKKIIWLAVISAGLYLTRPTGIIFFLAGLILILCYANNANKIKQAALFVFFFCVFISPWQLYQYFTFSKVSISSSNASGLNLYKGASPAIQSIYPEIDVDQAKEYILMELQGHGIDPKNEYLVNSFLTEKAVEFIKADPLLFVKNMMIKFLAFYFPVVTPLGKGDLVFYENKIEIQNFTLSIDFLRLNYFIICLIIIPFGIVEALQWKSGEVVQDKFKLFLLITFFLLTCVHILTFAETRFRLPLDGFLCILAGIFIYKKKNYFLTSLKIGSMALKNSFFTMLWIYILSLPAAAFARPGLTATGTFQNMGIEYTAPNGVGSETNEAHLQYKDTNSEKWENALDLYYNEDVDMYAGSVVNLQPGTSYDFRVILDSGEKEEIVANTWSEEFPIFKTIFLPKVSKEILHITSSGSDKGYILYTYDPDVGSATLDGEGKLDYNIEIADSVHHIIVDGLHLKNVLQNNILIGDYSNNIIIQNNELSFWGRNPFENPEPEGAISDKSLPSDLEKIVIQNNHIHSPNYPSWTWEVGHPQGPSGIMFRNTKGNHVIRNNTIEGSDSSYLAYGLRGAKNYSFLGGFGYNTDIYGNYISKTWGVAIECEGGNRNNRIYNNFTEHTFVHIAVAVNSVGPLYIFRNISGITRRDAKKRNSDIWGRSSFLKTGGNDTLEVKRIYLFNNLTLQPPPVGGGRKYGSGVQKAWNDAGARSIRGKPKEIIALNNIFRRADGLENNSIGDLKPGEECNNVIDYNMFLGNLPGFRECKFQENGITLHRGEHPQWDKENGTDENDFLDRNLKAGKFFLAPGAPGQGDGKSIPNFLPDSPVDMGPHQRGETPMLFGNREKF